MKNAFLLGLSALFVVSCAFAATDELNTNLKSKPAHYSVVRLGPGKPTPTTSVAALLSEDEGNALVSLLCAEGVEGGYMPKGFGYFYASDMSYLIKSYDSCIKLWETLMVASPLNPIIVEVDNGTGEVIGVHN